MPKIEVKSAREKDKELLTSMKLVTMIDDEMDKALSYNEKNKIRNEISDNINKHYKKYNIIYVDSKIAGCYLILDYLDGKIIDQFYLFEEYRRHRIGSRIINDIKAKERKLYAWVNRNNEMAISFFRNLGFVTSEENGRTLILKSDSVNTNILEQLKQIQLGYVDKDGKKNILIKEDFRKKYYLQSPSELKESKVGISLDQVELERDLIEKLGLDLRTYYIVYSDLNNELSHAFLIYKDNEKYYWLENAWYKYRGVREYDSLNGLLADVGNKLIESIDNGDINRIKLYGYDKPKYGISFNTFVSDVLNNKHVKI